MQSYMHEGNVCDFSYMTMGFKLAVAIQGKFFEFMVSEYI